jgi:hypothetical protein
MRVVVQTPTLKHVKIVGNSKIKDTNETKPIYCTLNQLILMNAICYCKIPFISIMCISG